MPENDKPLQPVAKEGGLEVNIKDAIEANRGIVLCLFDGNISGGKEAIGFIEQANAAIDVSGKLEYLMKALGEEKTSIWLFAPELIQLLDEANDEKLRAKVREIMSDDGTEWELAENAVCAPETMEKVLRTLGSLAEAGVVRAEFVDALTRIQALQKKGVNLNVMEDVDFLRHHGALDYGAHDPKRYAALAYQFSQLNQMEKAHSYSVIAMEMEGGGLAGAVFEDIYSEQDAGAIDNDILRAALAILESRPNPADIFNLVDKLGARGEHKEALTICREWHRLAPNDPDRTLLLVMTLMGLDKEGEVKEILMNMGEMNTGNPQQAKAVAMLSNLKLLYSPDNTQSEDFVYDESSAFSNSYMATMMAREGNTEETIRYTEKSLEINPNDADQRHLIIRMYASQRNYPKMIDHLEVLIQQYPDNPKYLEFMTQAYYSMGDNEQAEIFLGQALKLEPTADRYARLASLKLIKRDSESIDLYQKALEIEPENLLYLASLGIAYSSNNQPDEAFEIAEKGTELSSEDSQGYVLLARLFQQLGEQENAVKYIERAIRLDPTNTSALRARQKILKGEEIELN